LFLVIAYDGNLHWDETNYLYKAAFASPAAGAGWLNLHSGFYSGRLGHILILHLLFSLLGPGVLSLLGLQLLMACAVICTCLVLYHILKRIIPDPRLPFLIFIVLLFSPLNIYLAYKALPEVIAGLLAAIALLCFFSGLERKGKNGIALTLISGLFLFLAASARVESLLTYGAIVIPYLVFLAPSRKSILRQMIAVFLVWAVLTLITGILTGWWSFEFLINRFSISLRGGYLKDRLDYPPTIISALLFGGVFWILVVFSLLKRPGRILGFAWGSLLMTIVPIVLLVEHNEIRYYQPAVWGFSLCAALGSQAIYDWFSRKIPRRPALIFSGGLLVAAVLINQVLRPFYEIGTYGLPLLKLTRRVFWDYPDPLLVVAHPHSLYSFLRICYPDKRIALTRDYEGIAPLKVLTPSDIEDRPAPWLYLGLRRAREVPWLLRQLGLGDSGKEDGLGNNVNFADSWIPRSGDFRLEEVDGEGNYVVYKLSAGPISE